MTCAPARWLLTLVLPLFLVGCEQVLPSNPVSPTNIHLTQVVTVGGDDNSGCKTCPDDGGNGDDPAPTNTPPVLLLPSTITSEVGDSVAVDLTATDADGDSVVIGFDPQSAPRDCTITQLGGNVARLNCVISSSSPQDSPFTVRVTADDNRGGVTTGFFIWVVEEASES